MKTTWLVLTVTFVTGLCGCSRGGLNVVGGDATLAANEDSAVLLDRLASGKTVGENDAARGMVLLLDGKDSCRTFQDRITLLRGRGVVGEHWDFVADRAITRGRLAYMVYQACKMRGGLTLALAGPSERYCLRELAYRRMMTVGPELTPATGMEFVAVLSRADAYIRTGQSPEVLAAKGVQQ